MQQATNFVTTPPMQQTNLPAPHATGLLRLRRRTAAFTQLLPGSASAGTGRGSVRVRRSGRRSRAGTRRPS